MFNNISSSGGKRDISSNLIARYIFFSRSIIEYMYIHRIVRACGTLTWLVAHVHKIILCKLWDKVGVILPLLEVMWWKKATNRILDVSKVEIKIVCQKYISYELCCFGKITSNGYNLRWILMHCHRRGQLPQLHKIIPNSNAAKYMIEMYLHVWVCMYFLPSIWYIIWWWLPISTLDVTMQKHSIYT